MLYFGVRRTSRPFLALKFGAMWSAPHPRPRSMPGNAPVECSTEHYQCPEWYPASLILAGCWAGPWCPSARRCQAVLSRDSCVATTGNADISRGRFTPPGAEAPSRPWRDDVDGQSTAEYQMCVWRADAEPRRGHHQLHASHLDDAKPAASHSRRVAAPAPTALPRRPPARGWEQHLQSLRRRLMLERRKLCTSEPGRAEDQGESSLEAMPWQGISTQTGAGHSAALAGAAVTRLGLSAPTCRPGLAKKHDPVLRYQYAAG